MSRTAEDSKPVKLQSEEMPPVVVSRGKVSLADHLKLSELPLATTPGGKNFCIKALHPSEHTIKTARIPGSNVPSVAICSDQVVTINITNANSTVQILQTANPAVPCVASVRDGGVTHCYNFNNAAFSGTVVQDQTAASLQTFVQAMRERFEKYVILSQSVTAELIAPALSDQGTITSAQFQSSPYTCSAANLPSATTFQKVPDFWAYNNVLPASTWVLGSSAYTAKAREGFYQPLKLSKFKWRSTDDFCAYFDNMTPTAAIQTFNTNASIYFPYFVDRSGVINLLTLDLGLKTTCDSVGVSEINGIAAATAIRIRVRQIIEVTGVPGSFYSPMFEAPLPPDSTALTMYKEISARMADAYPASYNDLGKLRDIIYKIGKKILPFAEPVLDFASAVPGPVGAIASVGKKLLPTANEMMAKEKAKRKKRKAAARALPAPTTRADLPGRPQIRL